MRLFSIVILSLLVIASCKKGTESLPEFYVAANIGDQRVVMPIIETTIDQGPLRFTFSARDSNNLHRINFAVTDHVPAEYPQYVDTTRAPDLSEHLWLDCSYIPAGGVWRFLRPIAGKEPGLLTVTGKDNGIVTGSFHAWIGTADSPLKLSNGSFRIRLQ